MALRTLFISTCLTAAFASAACLSTATAAVSPSPALQRGKVADPPPGMVHLKGGRTKIGTDIKDIEEVILQDPKAQQRGNSLLSETPRLSMKLDPFFLMVNEVTNEQYEAFVRATGHQPPVHWAAEEAEKEARAAFLEADAERRKQAKEEGKKVQRRAFDKEKWWSDSWATSEWEIKAGTEHFPVQYVSHEDARQYARWAGVRLMTEFEFTHAVRGDSENTFPWGEKFDPENAATQERPERRSQPFPVGTFPGGAREGVYDLAGNVWEWTDSPYSPFKGYKPLKLKTGRGKQKVDRTFSSAWDADARVCVGGSIQNSKLAARATARRRVERIQKTEMIGFRCAASTRVGQDIAITVLAEDLPRSVRPFDEDGKVEYRTEIVLAYDRWKTSGEVPLQADSEAKDAASKKKKGDAAPVPASAPKGAAKGASMASSPPPGYAVIEDYDYMLFVPATAARYANQTALRKGTVAKQPAPLGVLSTTQPILTPKLDAGTYMVSFRGKGERKKRREKPADTKDDPDAPADDPAEDQEADDPYAWEVELGLDPAVDNFVFYNNEGAPIAVLPCGDSDWSYARMNPGKVGIIEVEIVEGEGKDKIVRQEKRLQFEVMLEGLTSSKGFRYNLPLHVDPDVLDQDWRTQ